MLTDSSGLQVNGETVKLGIPGAAQRMEASAKLMIPLQRVGTPEDAAGAMLMLASPYSSYISAQVMLEAPDLLHCSDGVCYIPFSPIYSFANLYYLYYSVLLLLFYVSILLTHFLIYPSLFFASCTEAAGSYWSVCT